MKNNGIIINILLLLFSFTPATVAQKVAVPFDTVNWDLARARYTEHLGHHSLAGKAYLKDVHLLSGTIEVDIATTSRTRSYPGIQY